MRPAAARRELRRVLEASGSEPRDTAQLAWGAVMGLVEAQVHETVSYALAHPPGPVDAAGALGPARWLLERATEGIALTQTGALNRALVREAVERWPGWWTTELFGPPNREDEIVPLGRLHELLRSLRLLRRTGRRIVATARARTLLAEPAALLEACATALLAGEKFDATVDELAAALLFAGEPIDYGPLARAIHPAILEQGWHSGGESPSVHAVGGAIGHLLAGLEALDLVTGSRRNGLRLTEVGVSRCTPVCAPARSDPRTGSDDQRPKMRIGSRSISSRTASRSRVGRNR